MASLCRVLEAALATLTDKRRGGGLHIAYEREEGIEQLPGAFQVYRDLLSKFGIHTAVPSRRGEGLISGDADHRLGSAEARRGYSVLIKYVDELVVEVKVCKLLPRLRRGPLDDHGSDLRYI